MDFEQREANSEVQPQESAPEAAKLLREVLADSLQRQNIRLAIVLHLEFDETRAEGKHQADSFVVLRESLRVDSQRFQITECQSHSLQIE